MRPGNIFRLVKPRGRDRITLQASAVAFLARAFLDWPHKARYTAGICFFLGPGRADISRSRQAKLPRALLARSWTSRGNVTEAT
jgi:hypothetical protein